MIALFDVILLVDVSALVVVVGALITNVVVPYRVPRLLVDSDPAFILNPVFKGAFTNRISSTDAHPIDCVVILLALMFSKAVRLLVTTTVFPEMDCSVFVFKSAVQSKY